MHVWHWFCELSAARGSTMGGFLPLSFTEIEAWARLYSVELQPWHVRAIRAMDTAFLGAIAKKPTLEDLTGE